MFSAFIKRFFSVFFVFSLFFILYSLFLSKPVFAVPTITNCNPTDNQPFDQGQPINFGGIVFYDIPASYTVNFSVTISGPENLSTGTIRSELFLAAPPNTTTPCTNIYNDSFNTPGTYSWYITGDIPGVGSTSSSPTNFIINTPPPNLGANVSFSGMSPTSGSYDNPVNFTGTVTDNEPTPGTRTVTLFVDGVPATSTTYVNNTGYSGTVSYTVPTPPLNNHSWYIKVELGAYSTTSPQYPFNINSPPPSFSNPSPPNGATVISNDVTFSINITDYDSSDLRGRTVDLFVDGSLREVRSNAYNGSVTNFPISSSPIALPNGPHSWYVQVWIPQLNPVYHTSGTYSFTVSASNSPPDKPTNLLTFGSLCGINPCVHNPPDPTGRDWWNYNPDYEATTTDQNGDTLTPYFNTPTGQHIGTYFGPLSNTSGYSENLSDGIYSWSIFTRDTSNAQSPTSDTVSFGIDRTPPSGPGDPALSFSGGWVWNWQFNGSDQPGPTVSGLYATLTVLSGQDSGGNEVCSHSSWFGGGSPPISEPFQCTMSDGSGTTTSPQPSMHYVYEVWNYDWAGNRSVMSQGSYDTGGAPTYAIEGYVFIDNGPGAFYRNGDWDPGEQAYVEGAEVILSGGANLTTTSKTRFQLNPGYYSFTDLLPGSYTLNVGYPVGDGFETTNTPYSFILSFDTPKNLGIVSSAPVNSPTPTVTPTTSPNYPSTSLRVYNAAPTPTFQSSYGLSGNQSGTPGGSNWLNPMMVRLSATAQTGYNIVQYYIAFYDKTLNGSNPYSNDFKYDATYTKLHILPSPNFTSLRNALNNTNGFIIAYGTYISGNGTTVKFYVWDKNLNGGAGGWGNITGSSYRLCNGACNASDTTTYFTIDNCQGTSPLTNSGYLSCRVTYDKKFGNRSMFTAVGAKDSYNYITGYGGRLSFRGENAPQP
ncbi:MAG: hypothetical protein Q7K55_06985 [Candidatus Levybacteria bacterium]|nr:hypothetical protein [Candidatus Levybacteria bacterium]